MTTPTRIGVVHFHRFARVEPNDVIGTGGDSGHRILSCGQQSDGSLIGLRACRVRARGHCAGTWPLGLRACRHEAIVQARGHCAGTWPLGLRACRVQALRPPRYDAKCAVRELTEAQQRVQRVRELALHSGHKGGEDGGAATHVTLL